MTEQISSEARILIVDDLKSARKVLHRMLENVGYKYVIDCDLGSEALDIIGKGSVDLVISDLNLRDTTGTSLFTKILEIAGCEELPFILVTSDRSNDALDDDITQKMSGFLLKPFNAVELKQRVEAALLR